MMKVSGQELCLSGGPQFYIYKCILLDSVIPLIGMCLKITAQLQTNTCVWERSGKGYLQCGGQNSSSLKVFNTPKISSLKFVIKIGSILCTRSDTFLSFMLFSTVLLKFYCQNGETRSESLLLRNACLLCIVSAALRRWLASVFRMDSSLHNYNLIDTMFSP